MRLSKIPLSYNGSSVYYYMVMHEMLGVPPAFAQLLPAESLTEIVLLPNLGLFY